ncbi:MAG: MATE family efflux transporter [Proteobacteria bacterium]|nr:MATE family efflux transporter [Pseudomonadota bacterium]
MDLRTDKISTLFKKYFIPTLFGMLSMSAVTAIDGVFVGHGIGSDGIAAVNICIPLLMIFTGIGLMAGIGSSVISSIYLSKGKIKTARLNVTQSILFSTLVATIPSVFMMFFLEETAYFLGSSEYLLPMVKEYLIWFIPSLTFQMWLSVSLFIIRLDGAPKLAMWFNISAALITTVLGGIFIFPLQMGLTGAALAPTLALLIGGSVSLYYLIYRAKILRLYPLKLGFRGFRLFIYSISEQCQIGFSALLGEATMAVLMFVGNHIFLQYLGDNGVGAFGIACYYMPFVFMIGNAIAQSAQPIISYNYGLYQHDRVIGTEKLALITAVICGGIVSFVFVVFPEVLVGLFLKTDNPAAGLAIKGFPYFAFGFICFVLNLTVIGYFQSIEKPKPAAFFAFLRGFAFLIPAFILVPQVLGEEGIWLAMPISETLTTIACLIFFVIKNESRLVQKAYT